MKNFQISLINIFICFVGFYANGQQISGATPIIINPDVTIPFNGEEIPQPYQYLANGDQEFTVICGVEDITMIAKFNDVGTTDTYLVEEIPYAPARFEIPGAGEVGAQIPQTADDTWSNILPVGANTDPDAMNFCFFQNAYKQFILNTNGVVSFDINAPAGQTPNQQPGGFATWVLQGGGQPYKLGSVGNTNLFSNSIFFPMHDPNPNDPDNAANAEYAYWTILGTAPNRKFIMVIHDTAMFSCGNPSTTQQVIFYETTNIIEVHMLNKPVCSQWNGGLAVVGIQNSARDVSFPAASSSKDRDTGVWTVTSLNAESWRFTPSGNAGTAPVFAWYTDYGLPTETLISTDTELTINDPTNDITYTAVVTYTEACSGQQIIETQNINIILDNPLTGEIVDDNPPNDPVDSIFLCAGSADTFTALVEVEFDNSTGQTVEYEWVQVSTGTIVGTTDTFIIDETNITTATEEFDVQVTLLNPDGSTECDFTDTITVEIRDPFLEYALSNYCIQTDPDPLAINVLPLGGVFTINNGGSINSVNGEIDLTASSSGTNNTGNFTVTYTIGTAPNDCNDTFDLHISDPAITVTTAPFCSTDLTTYSLEVTTTGGTITSPDGGTVTNTSGNIWTITAIPDGTDIVINLDDNGCTTTLSVTAPDCSCPTINAPIHDLGDLTVCVQNPIQTLTATAIAPTTPAGTTVVWYDAATGGTIVPIPELNAVGTITYYAESTLASPACTSSTRLPVTLTINPLDDASFSYPSATVCIANATLATNLITTPGGEFTINNGGVINIISGVVDLTASGAGTFQITYTTPAANVCTNLDTFDLTISAQDDTDFGYDNDTDLTESSEDYCKSDLTTGLPNPLPPTSGGTYTISNSGIIDPLTGEIDLNATPASNVAYTITYTTTGSCANNSSFDIILHEDEVANFNYDNSYCIDATDPTPNITATTGGEFTINNGGVININSGEINLSASALGTDSTGNFTITYTTQGTFCPDEDTFNVTIFETPDLDAQINITECGAYTLPTILGTGLTGNESYFTETNGGGTQLNEGDLIAYDSTATYPITIFIYDQTNTTPNCFDQESFQLTINIGPVINSITDQLHCDSYTLPTITGTNLSSNESYYTGANGSGTAYLAGTILNYADFATYPVTLYLFDETNTTPNCTYEESFELTLFATPDIIDLADQIVCDQYELPAIAGTNLTTSVSYYDNTTGTGNSFAVGDIITYDSSATYPLTFYIYDASSLTTPNCSDQESFTLTINPTPIITALADQEHCDTFVLPAITGSNITSSARYYDGANGSGTSFNVGQTLNFLDFPSYPVTLYIYDATGTNPDCTDQQSFSLIINPTPIINALTDQELCDSYELPLITGTNLTSNVMYYDNMNGTGTAYAPLTTINFADFTAYPVTLYAFDSIGTVGNECTSQEEFELILHATPSITTLADQEECGFIILPAIAGTNLSGTEMYYDNINGTGNSYNASDIINFNDYPSYPITLYIYDELGLAPNICTNETSFELTLNIAPIIDPINNVVACDSYLLPAITGTNLTGSQSYFTNTNGGGTAYLPGVNLVYSDFAPADYPVTLYAYDETGLTTNCPSEEMFTLTINATPDIDPLPNASITICDSFELPAITGTNLTGNESYYDDINGLGNAFSAATIITYDNTVTYPITFYIFDQTATTPNCLDQESFQLTINPSPSINVILDQEHCDSYQLPLITGTNLTGNESYFTQPNGGGLEIPALTTLNYTDFLPSDYPITLYAFDDTDTVPNCTSEQFFTLLINPTPIIDVINDKVVCNNYVLPAITGTNITSNASYYDNVNGTGNAYAVGTVLNYSDFTTYPVTLYAFDTVGSVGNQCTNEQAFDLEINTTPQFELPFQAFICPSNNVDTYITVENPQGNYTYEWFDPNGIIVEVGDTLTLNNTSEIGIYTAVATVATSDLLLFCSNEPGVQVLVSIDDQVVITNVHVNDFNRPNNSITIEVEGGTGDFTYTIIDSNGNETSQNSPVFENLLSEVYTVQVLDNQGCSVGVFQTDIAVLDYPLYFSPNGDSINDTWTIHNSHLIPNSKIYIFDRYGKVLAQVNPNSVVGWDGIYLGKQLPATDYWFTAEYLDPNTLLQKTVKGHFSIVRRGSI